MKNDNLLHYKDLTEEEQNIVTNGCGPKKFLNFIYKYLNKHIVTYFQNFLFFADCKHHDFLYWRGHTEKDRFKADGIFFILMLKDAWRNFALHFTSKLGITIYILKGISYSLLAIIYYISVILFGWLFFYYGDKPRDREDLNNLLRDKE